MKEMLAQNSYHNQENSCTQQRYSNRDMEGPWNHKPCKHEGRELRVLRKTPKRNPETVHAGRKSVMDKERSQGNVGHDEPSKGLGERNGRDAAPAPIALDQEDCYCDGAHEESPAGVDEEEIQRQHERVFQQPVAPEQGAAVKHHHA